MDFESHIMDDRNILVIMNDHICSVLDGEKVGLSPDDTEVPISLAIAARCFCLASAERGEVVALIEPDNYVYPNPKSAEELID